MKITRIPEITKLVDITRIRDFILRLDIMSRLERLKPTTIRRIIVVFIMVNLLCMATYGYLSSQSEAADPKKQVPATPAVQTVPISAEMQWNTLQKRQEELRIKEAQLKTLEVDLNAKLKRLEELETMLRQDVSSLRTQSDERIKHLVKIYSSMNPKAAAKLMDNMDLLVAVEVFHNMKGEIAGGILANVEATKAASITKMLATYRAAARQATPQS